MHIEGCVKEVVCQTTTTNKYGKKIQKTMYHYNIFGKEYYKSEYKSVRQFFNLQPTPWALFRLPYGQCNKCLKL